jgi:hypothetical protein
VYTRRGAYNPLDSAGRANRRLTAWVELIVPCTREAAEGIQPVVERLIADPGPGFTFDNLDHAAIAHDNPIDHLAVRDSKGGIPASTTRNRTKSSPCVEES